MITKSTCQNFRTDLNAAVEELKKKYNLEIKIGSIRYSSNTMSIKLEAVDAEVGTAGIQREEFVRNCIYFQMTPEDFGKTFIDDKGHRHKIVGIKPRSRKYPILTRNLTTDGDGMTGTTKWNSSHIKGFLR